RKNSKKYIDAALLAHKGFTPAQIADKIDLSIPEIEFICKVNKDRLMFSEEQLPTWAKTAERDLSDVFSQSHYEELKDLGEKFRSVSIAGGETKSEATPVFERKIPDAIDVIS